MVSAHTSRLIFGFSVSFVLILPMPAELNRPSSTLVAEFDFGYAYACVSSTTCDA